MKDGLSQNWVRCIYQDDQGFMWFGASGGLNRYDGYEIKIYSLGKVNINAIAKKSDHELWICNDLGVFIYDREKDSIHSFQYLKDQTVLSILQELNGTVWFGTNTGLYRYTPSDNKLFTYLSDEKDKGSLSNNYVNTLFQDSDDNLWIGTKVGLNKYVRSTDSFIRYRNSTKPGSLSGNDIMTICEDQHKRIWVGTAKDGVNLLLADEKEIYFRKIVNGAIVSLLVDNKNVLWIGTSSNGGVLQIDLNNLSVDKTPDIVHFKKNRIDPVSLSDNSIFCIYKDRLNDIWIGTFGGGVNYFSYRSKNFYSIKEGVDDKPAIENDFVNAIWEEDRFLWLGTEGGLDRFDKITQSTRHFKYEGHDASGLSSDPVYALHKDNYGNLWVGTWTGGLNLYNYKTESFRRFIPDQKPGSISSENVFAIYEDSRNNLWIGTVGGGLNRYNYKTGTFTHYKHDQRNPKSLYIDIIHDIAETKDGRLLVAAYGSLDIFDYATESFTHYPLNENNSDDINNRFIIVIFKDSRHNIWLGTNEGLLLFKGDGFESHVITTLDGLAGNTVQGIEEDSHGNLWISTNDGLSKFIDAVDHPKSPVFINFNEYDGLAGDEFKSRAVYKSNTGLIYLGTSQGFSYFHPDSITLNLVPPEIVFVEMQLLQFQSGNNSEEKFLVQNINALEKVELPFNKSDFVMTFAALNYLNPQKNKYKYMLSGYDPDWVLAGNHRSATYKNLQPGKYTFMVLGSNNDGIWSKSPRTLQIIIQPPFWQTWWFRIALILIFLGIIFLVFSWRLKSIKKEKRKLEKLVGERTTELSEANVKLEEQREELINQNEELMQHQEQLSLYKDQLEELVIKRTSELEKAKTKAEESDRLKSTFLANMSHEIRTPLNAIVGFTGLFDEADTDAETRKTYHNIIQANTETLLRLIDDILDLSTIEANQLTMKLKLFSPLEILREVYQQFLPQATESVEFLLKIDENAQSTLINSDEYRFRQILTNLVSNAFKFTEVGSIEIGFYPNQADQLVFYVKDSGIGISEEEHRILFSHFTKVEKPLKLFRGVGLGLAICKQLTELLGGKIWLESEPGKGSTFFFTQPISK
jgi:signal transduction histidine kinase/ligand-binding sensor domain-containing protein